MERESEAYVLHVDLVTLLPNLLSRTAQERTALRDAGSVTVCVKVDVSCAADVSLGA